MPPSDQLEVIRWLVAGGPNDHTHLYYRSATFHHAVDTLVVMLPAMIDGLAANAERQDELRRQMQVELERGPITGGFRP
jgi:hypothetical protein